MLHPNSNSAAYAFLYFLVAVCGWTLYITVYRLAFHPLAQIPGPRFAAASYLYQTCFCFVGGSRFYQQIERLHKKYGPVVRITPDEIHLSDPDNYECIYHVGSKYSKCPQFYGSFGLEYGTFITPSNEVHRQRRGRLNPLFSQKMVLELEDVVQSKAEKLCALLDKKFSVGLPIDLHHGFRAISVDVITDYGFNKCYDLLDKPDLGLNFFAMVRGIGPAMWIFQLVPGLQNVSKMIPPPVLKIMSKPLAQVLTLQEHAREQIVAVKSDMDAGKVIPGSRTTIFQELLTPDIDEGYVVPPIDDLKGEAYGILAAAADTTGNAMTVAAQHVVSNPVIYEKLTAELRAAFPDPNSRLDFLTLEKLPYLSGVIKEGLRLSFGVIGRMPRIVPEPGATFNGYAIPPGTIVSMSSWILHQDEDYFPNAKEFNPDRWSNLKEARRMDKCFIPFGKGSRACVGMPLAYCELYVTLGTLFRRFEHLEASKLSPGDLLYDDYFSSYHPLEAEKFHVSAGNGS